jgi:hypothetical protein
MKVYDLSIRTTGRYESKPEGTLYGYFTVKNETSSIEIQLTDETIGEIAKLLTRQLCETAKQVAIELPTANLPDVILLEGKAND